MNRVKYGRLLNADSENTYWYIHLRLASSGVSRDRGHIVDKLSIQRSQSNQLPHRLQVDHKSIAYTLTQGA